MEETNKNKNTIYLFIAIIIILFVYVAYSVYQNNKNKKMEEANSTTTNQVSEGQLRVAEAGDVIVINYSGKLENGTEIDSSYKRGQPFVFQVGVGQVIKGWDEVLRGAKRGDKKTLSQFMK